MISIKPQKDVLLSARIDKDLNEKIEHVKALSGASKADVIRSCLEVGLDMEIAIERCTDAKEDR